MELDNKNMILQPLLDNADLFSCAIEMATYLAMMQIGGPKKFFLWHVDAQQQGSGENIPSRFQKSLQHCYDDLELALWLMRAWFQSVSTHQERKKWAQEWEIDYELLTSVGNIRYQLLKDRLQNKKDGEVARPVDLRLIPKARLLLAHY